MSSRRAVPHSLFILAVSWVVLVLSACGDPDAAATENSATTVASVASATTVAPPSTAIPVPSTVAETAAPQTLATVEIETSTTTSTAPTEGRPDDEPGEVQPRVEDPPVVGVYVPYWDMAAARQAIENGTEVITDVSMFAYRIRADGGVELHDEQNGQVDGDWVRELRAEGKRVFATVTNDLPAPERWSPAVVHEVVSDPERRQRHVDSLVALAQTGGFDGIEIDYEALDPADRNDFAVFLADLGAALHQRELLLAVDVQAFETGFGGDAYDRASIAASVDQFRIMTYTYSWETSAAGPIAPLPWVERVLAAVLEVVPTEKVYLGVAGFGIDWPDGAAGSSVTWAQAQTLLGPDGIAWSPEDAEWTGRYEGHEVWFADGRTARLRAEVARSSDLPGVFVWGAPGASPDFWTEIERGLEP